MTQEKLVHMANQIALFFAANPHDEAVTGIAEHLRAFWEPRMLNQLRAHMAAGGAGLHGLVREAWVRLEPAA